MMLAKRGDLDLAQHVHTSQDIAAHYERERVFGIGEGAKQERASLVTASFWPLIGVHPLLGRFFNESEDQLPNGTPVAVLGYGYWQSQFGGRRDQVPFVEVVGCDERDRGGVGVQSEFDEVVALAHVYLVVVVADEQRCRRIGGEASAYST